jgi:hypothetical protein
MLDQPNLSQLLVELEPVDLLIDKVPTELSSGFDTQTLRLSLEKAIELVRTHPGDETILLREGDAPFLFPIPNGVTLELVFQLWKVLTATGVFFETIGTMGVSEADIPRRTQINKFWVHYFLRVHSDVTTVLDLMCSFHPQAYTMAAQQTAALIDVLQVREFPAEFSKESMNEFVEVLAWVKKNNLEDSIYRQMYLSGTQIRPHIQTLLHVMLFKQRQNRSADPIPANTGFERIMKRTLPHFLSITLYFLEQGKQKEARDEVKALKRNLPRAYYVLIRMLESNIQAHSLFKRLDISQEELEAARRECPEPHRLSGEFMEDVRAIESDITVWVQILRIENIKTRKLLTMTGKVERGVSQAFLQ